MPRFARSLGGLALFCAATASLAPPSLRAQHAAPATYAITDARIVTVSGAVVERGSVVIRDGLITAVGARARVPADARVIAGEGLTVYPGLIDAASSLGMPARRAGASPAGAAASPNSPQREGMRPELLAADFLEADAARIIEARQAGFTATVTAPASGIYMGQSAVVVLAGDAPHEMVVRSPAALHVAFTPLGGGYPGSLLGVFAALRQSLIDAQHYRDAHALYARDSRGLRRPAPDRSLEALQPVLARQLPVVMYANQERQIIRALDLAEEFDLRVIIAGGSEAWKIAPRLRAMNVPVIATLSFPRAPASRPADAEPEPLRVIRDRIEAPRNPGLLAAAGVALAFQTGGLSFGDVRTSVARAVEHGLGRDQAIRALTLTPAEIFGVADRLGSVEVGKIANLTLVRGDLLDTAARVAHVFIDGRPVVLPEQRVRPDPRTSVAAEAQRLEGITGTWALTVAVSGEEMPVTVHLRQQGEELRGTMQGALGSVEIADGSADPGGTFRFTATITLQSQTTEARFEGSAQDDAMRGTVQVVGLAGASFPFTGTRPGRP